MLDSLSDTSVSSNSERIRSGDLWCILPTNCFWISNPAKDKLGWMVSFYAEIKNDLYSAICYLKQVGLLCMLLLECYVVM